MSTPAKSPKSLFAIVITHYLLSAICFIIFSVMLLFATEELSGHYFNPRLLAITHVCALGWATLIIFGAAYQLIPVIFETELYCYKLPWVSLLFYLSGLGLLVRSFWIFDPGIFMQAGSILLLAGIGLFVLQVVLTSKKAASNGNIYQEFMVTSCIWLLGTAILGLLLVFNFRYAFLPKDHLQFLKLHAHMGIGGWFLLLIMGVSAKLIPMFLVSRIQNEKRLKMSYYMVNLALILFLFDTYLFGINFKTYLILIILIAGIISFGLYITECVKTRLKKHIDLPMANTFLSLALLTTAVMALPAIIYYQLKGDAISLKLSMIYGSLLLMGWITSIILGQAFKTLPFLVWVNRYEDLAGKTKVPQPADLYNKALLRFQTYLFLLFIGCFYAGLIFKQGVLQQAGAVALLCTALAYFINLLTVIFHRSKVLRHDKV
jgi:hypothetical protein